LSKRDDIDCRRGIRAAVVTGHLTLRVNPNFTPKLTIPTLLRDVVRIVDNFSISRDSNRHGCLPAIH